MIASVINTVFESPAQNVREGKTYLWFFNVKLLEVAKLL